MSPVKPNDAAMERVAVAAEGVEARREGRI